MKPMWVESARVMHVGPEQRPHNFRDFSLVAQLGPKPISLFQLSDLADGRWLVTSRYIPTRIAGTILTGAGRGREAAERALSGYVAWVHGLSNQGEGK